MNTIERGGLIHMYTIERGGLIHIPLKYALNRSTPCCRSATPIISRMLCMDSWGMPVRD